MSAEIPVAIVGIGCKFPGGSDNKELYYEFLRNKVRRSDFAPEVSVLIFLVQRVME